ncbi:MAG: VWA domain-containing protein [Gammaproteobacteria bacterium]
MSCGFGAVVLLFLIIKHNADVKDVMPEFDLGIELELLEKDIGDAQTKLGNARSRASTLEADLLSKEQLAELARKELDKARAAASNVDPAVTNEELQEMKDKLKRLADEKDRLQREVNKQSNSVRTFVGEGNREYLTGLKLGGQRILILLDASASMLDDTIVNVIRRRNMDDSAKRRSWKWQQGIATVDWISARFPPNAKFQIYVFNTQAQAVLPQSRGQWLEVSSAKALNDSMNALRKIVPGGGSSLINALGQIQNLSPLPDNVFLITDGLPTQGQSKPRGSTVSGVQRQRLFEQAVTKIPRGIPINSILLPMEGDPVAAWAYWTLALYTKGAFLTPARDWP